MRRGGDWISLAGLRTDGRRPHEIRRIRTQLGTVPSADGSAYLEQGQTKVLAVVFGPHEVSRRSDIEHDKAVIECDFYNAPFSGLERKKRRQMDRKSLEVSIAVKQVMEAGVMLHLYPRTQIDIYLHLLQSDGSPLPACINAASLALVDAGIAMKEMVTACSVGFLDGVPALDVNNVEQSSGAAYMPVAVMASREEVVLVQSESRIDVAKFGDLLRAGIDAAKQVAEILQAQLKEHTRATADLKAALLR